MFIEKFIWPSEQEYPCNQKEKFAGVVRCWKWLDVSTSSNIQGRRMPRVKKNKPCKSTDMQPRSWMGENWVPPWRKMASCQPVLEEKVAVKILDTPKSFYHVPTSMSQWGIGPLLLYFVVAHFFSSSVRKCYFGKSPIRPFLKIHWWCIVLFIHSSQKHFTKENFFFFSAFCTREKWSLERWSDCPESES